MLRAFCDEGVSLLIHIERFNLAFLFEDRYAFIKRMTYKPSSKYTVGTSSMPIQKGVQTAPTQFFQLMIPIQSQVGHHRLSAKHHLNGAKAFRWREEHGPTLNAL